MNQKRLNDLKTDLLMRYSHDAIRKGFRERDKILNAELRELGIAVNPRVLDDWKLEWLGFHECLDIVKEER